MLTFYILHVFDYTNLLKSFFSTIYQKIGFRRWNAGNIFENKLYNFGQIDFPYEN
jgi:hypothetical protein